MTFDDFLQAAQYSLPQREKEALLTEELGALTEYHRRRCDGYARLLGVLHAGYNGVESLSDVPYLPVGLFKSHMLQSVP
jgi:hypothetical protein